MKGTVAYITRHIKARLIDEGFKKEKYCFVKSLKDNYELELYISSVNFIDFQDMQISFRLKNIGKIKLMEYLNEIYFNEPNSSLLTFRLTQFDKMNDTYFGEFNLDKYWIANEQDAKIFISDLNQFLDKSLSSEKINALSEVSVIEKLINDPDVFTSPVVEDIDYSRFYDGLIYSKLSKKKNIDTVYSKYIQFTSGWTYEAKLKIKKLFNKLKSIEIETLEKLYNE